MLCKWCPAYSGCDSVSRPEQVRQYFLLVECNHQDEIPVPFEDKKHPIGSRLSKRQRGCNWVSEQIQAQITGSILIKPFS
jgi:hypothetical protein